MRHSTRARQERAWLPISDAARALGVSTSTLRAWSAEGRVPHVRTAGGHRRFNPAALADWLATSPDPATPRTERSTHVSPRPAAADALADRIERIADLAADAHGGDPPRVTRDRVLVLAQALRTGRLGEALERADAFGRAHGAAGSPAERALEPALRFERAVDEALSEPPMALTPDDRDHVSATIRRITVRVADSWAAATAEGRAPQVA